MIDASLSLFFVKIFSPLRARERRSWGDYYVIKTDDRGGGVSPLPSPPQKNQVECDGKNISTSYSCPKERRQGENFTSSEEGKYPMLLLYSPIFISTGKK